MNKIKIEVHPSVLLVILAMCIVVFFVTSQKQTEVFEIQRDRSIEKTYTEVYEDYPHFPHVADTTLVYPPFLLEGEWYEYNETKFVFIKNGMDGLGH